MTAINPLLPASFFILAGEPNLPRRRTHSSPPKSVNKIIEIAIGVSLVLGSALVVAKQIKRFSARTVALNMGFGVLMDLGAQVFFSPKEDWDWGRLIITSAAGALAGGVGFGASFQAAWGATTFASQKLIQYGILDGLVVGALEGGLSTWEEERENLGENMSWGRIFLNTGGGAFLGALSGTMMMPLMRGAGHQLETGWKRVKTFRKRKQGPKATQAPSPPPSQHTSPVVETTAVVRRPTAVPRPVGRPRNIIEVTRTQTRPAAPPRPKDRPPVLMDEEGPQTIAEPQRPLAIRMQQRALADQRRGELTSPGRHHALTPLLRFNLSKEGVLTNEVIPVLRTQREVFLIQGKRAIQAQWMEGKLKITQVTTDLEERRAFFTKILNTRSLDVYRRQIQSDLSSMVFNVRDEKILQQILAGLARILSTLP